MADVFHVPRGGTATPPSSGRAVPPRGVRGKPAHGHLTTLIEPFTAIEPFQDGFPPGSFRDVATQKQKSIIAYMLSHAITPIIVFVFDSPRPMPIPYGFPTVSYHAVTSGYPSSLRCINRSRLARKRARCRAACAPDGAQRDTPPLRPLVPRVRSRSLGYQSISPHHQNKVTPTPTHHWAALRHPSSLHQARHAAREKAGHAWLASTKAAMGFRLSMVAVRFAVRLTMLAVNPSPPFYCACLIAMRRHLLFLTGNVPTSLRILNVCGGRSNVAHSPAPPRATPFHC